MKVQKQQNYLKTTLAIILLSTAAAYPLRAAQGESSPPAPKPWVKTSDHTTLISARDFTPEKVQKITFEHEAMKIDLYARSFAPGEAVYVEIIPVDRKGLSGYRFTFNDQEILLSRLSWGYRGFFGISPWLNDKIENTRSYSFGVAAPSTQSQHNQNYPILIQRADFMTSRSTLDVGRYTSSEKTAEEISWIERSREKKSVAYATLSSNWIRNRLAHPRDFHYITSPFWATRIYARYKVVNGEKVYQKPRVSIHRGLDFRAALGAPIYSIAPGRVVLAEQLYYEGNCVILNHGNAIFSVYSHMSKLNVFHNQYVRAGKVIGLAGETGQVTGPHLHLAVIINSVPVDPLGFLSLPVRY